MAEATNDDKPIAAEDIQAMLDRSPFISFLGLRVDRVDVAAQEIEMTMPMRPELERGAGTGQFHGGPIASFIDTVGDFAVVLATKGGVPTINFRVDYLRPSTGAALKGIARARRIGRSVAVVDIEILDLEGRLCALGRGTYSPTVG